MDRLRKAYQALAVVLIPVTAVYSFHVLQYPTGPVGRAEAALRSAVAVGAVIWAVFYVGRIIGENRAHRQAVGRVQVLRENTVPMPVVPQPVVEPTGLDPKVVELGRRIARGLDRAPDVRQED